MSIDENKLNVMFCLRLAASVAFLALSVGCSGRQDQSIWGQEWLQWSLTCDIEYVSSSQRIKAVLTNYSSSETVSIMGFSINARNTSVTDDVHGASTVQFRRGVYDGWNGPIWYFFSPETHVSVRMRKGQPLDSGIKQVWLGPDAKVTFYIDEDPYSFIKEAESIEVWVEVFALRVNVEMDTKAAKHFSYEEFGQLMGSHPVESSSNTIRFDLSKRETGERQPSE